MFPKRIENLLTDAQYAIALRIEASQSHIRLGFTYWEADYSETQAQSIACTLTKAISGLVNWPSSPVASLDIMGEQNIARLQEWNKQLPQSINRCVHHVIREWVQKQPQHPAVCTTEVELDYETLDDLSGRLAHHLVGLGAGPGVVVPFSLDKSAWAVVAMLATVKAGAATCFIDPKYPVERTAGIIGDVKAKILISAPEYASRFEGIVDAVVPLDRDMLFNLPLVGHNSDTVSPSDLIAVVFTSGSTGKPKGILLEHSAFVTNGFKHGSTMRLQRDTRHLQFAAYTFDACLDDVFTTLMLGGTVCCPTEDERMSDLTGFINRTNCTSALITPTVASTLHPSKVPSIETLTLGGEALGQEHIDTWADAVYLINAYGPAECTITSTINPGVTRESSPSNIGSAGHAGARVWVSQIDQPYRLAPIGAVGELLIEGPKLARGYIDPTQTSKAFLNSVTWPGFEETTDRRVYKTGDLVRYNSDGTISYCGRKDTQVKLRGQRIELSEVEHHVTQHSPSGISQVAVEAVKMSSRSTVLVAFLAMAGKDEKLRTGEPCLLDNELRQQFKDLSNKLSDVLPGYMIPSMFVPMTSLPINGSGKTNRKQLQCIVGQFTGDQVQVYSLAGAEKRKPSTTIERRLRNLYADVLAISEDEVGTDESFTRMGGDSIQAMRLVGMASAVGISLTVADILRHKTVVRLAEAVANNSASSSDSGTMDKPAESSDSASQLDDSDSSVPDKSDFSSPGGKIEAVYRCLSSQAELLQATCNNPSAGFYHVENIFEVSATGGLSTDSNRLEDAWQHVVNRHAALRTTFVINGFQQDQIVLRYAPALVEHVECADWEVTSTIKKHPTFNFQLSNPLHRLTMFKTDAGRTICKLDIHHAIIDGPSTVTLFEDFSRAYAGTLPRGQAPQIKDCIAHVGRYGNTKAAMQHWKRILGDAKPTQFPTISTKPAAGLGELQHGIHISGSTSSIRSVCKEHEVTIPSLINAAWSLVLRSLTGQSDVSFGYLSSARSSMPQALSGTVGFLVDKVTCRSTTAGSASLLAHVKAVHESILANMAHQHIGPAEMARALGRRPEQQPLFNSLVNFRKFDVAAARQKTTEAEAEQQEEEEEEGLAFKVLSVRDPMEYDVTLACSEMEKGVHVVASWWESRVSERDVRSAVDMLEAVLGMWVEDVGMSCDAVERRLSLG
jgi:amino acid adenylation domain-containing protein